MSQSILKIRIETEEYILNMCGAIPAPCEAGGVFSRIEKMCDCKEESQ